MFAAVSNLRDRFTSVSEVRYQTRQDRLALNPRCLHPSCYRLHGGRNTVMHAHRQLRWVTWKFCLLCLCLSHSNQVLSMLEDHSHL